MASTRERYLARIRTQITVLIPDELSVFVREQAVRRHQTCSDVVLAALRTEMRRCVIEQEIAAYQTYPDTDFAVLSKEQVAEARRDLD